MVFVGRASVSMPSAAARVATVVAQQVDDVAATHSLGARDLLPCNRLVIRSLSRRKTYPGAADECRERPAVKCLLGWFCYSVRAPSHALVFGPADPHAGEG